MPESNQPETQQSYGSSQQLQLRAHNIVLLVERLGIISNEIQAVGSILESLGAAITVQGNLIGAYGFKMETTATRLHTESVQRELQEPGGDHKSILLLQLEAYNILLAANNLGIMSNQIQAFGAEIQTAAGIIIAYGNILTVKAFELETIATRLQIAAVLQEMGTQQDLPKYNEYTGGGQLNNTQEIAGNKESKLDQLSIKMQQIEDSVIHQQVQIQEIQRDLNKLKGKR